MSTIKNTIKEFIIFIILIANINVYFRISTIEGQRFSSNDNTTVINIDKRSVELFGSSEWISLRHLYNIEHGKNWISIEKLIILADALEENPIDLFAEIVAIYRNHPH